ncbi:MAG TPA: YggT family protein [Firmicutes bacterium]|nr:YggT family protein [Bacillota bacterium]
MRILLVIIKIYIWLIVAWAIMTWIPGLSGSAVHNILGLPIVPVLNIFSFANIGFIGLQAIIVIGILWFVESWLEKKLKEQEGAGAQAYTRPAEPHDDDQGH